MQPVSFLLPLLLVIVIPVGFLLFVGGRQERLDPPAKVLPQGHPKISGKPRPGRPLVGPSRARASSSEMNLSELMNKVDELMAKTNSDPHALEEAVGLLTEAIRRHKHYGYALRLKANLLRIGRAPAESVAAWRQYLAHYPDDMNGAHALGLQLIRLEKYEEAELVLKQAIQAYPDYRDAHRALVQVYRALGNQDRVLFHQKETDSGKNHKPPLLIHPRLLGL